MSQDSVRLMCPNLSCRKVLAVPERARGRTVKCKNCGTVVRVPIRHGERPAPPNRDTNAA